MRGNVSKTKIKTTPESKEFKRLKELDFEFQAPQDEYSYQPDSGSIANGQIAKDEYGIDIVEDAKTPHKKYTNSKASDLNVEESGESEWSQDHAKASEVEKNLE